MIRISKHVLAAAIATFATSTAIATIVVPTNQATIQAAINVAVPGEDIFVLPGTYPEGAINVTLPVQIYGPNVGVGPPQVRAVEARVVGGFVLTSSGVTIQGFEIIGGVPDPVFPTITRSISGVAALNDINVSYNWMHQPTGGFSYAVDLGDFNGARSQNWVIDSNLINGQIPGSSQGINLSAADNVTVVGNHIVLTTISSPSGDYGFPGVVLDGVHNAVVGKNNIDAGQTNSNNSSVAHGVGVQASIDDIQDVSIVNNRMTNCVSGVLSSSASFAIRNLALSRNDIEARMFGIQMQSVNVGSNLVSHDGVAINNNHFTAGNYCVGVIGGSAPARTMSNIVLRRNCFAATSGSTGVRGVAVSSNATIPTHGGLVDARRNYWDASNGPSTVGSGSGLGVTAKVDFSKWLDSCPH